MHVTESTYLPRLMLVPSSTEGINRMKSMLKKFVAVTALTLAAFGVAAGTASAESAPAPTPDDLVVGIFPGGTYIGYSNGTAALVSGGGTVLLQGGGYRVLDGSGAVIF